MIIWTRQASHLGNQIAKNIKGFFTFAWNNQQEQIRSSIPQMKLKRKIEWKTYLFKWLFFIQIIMQICFLHNDLYINKYTWEVYLTCKENALLKIGINKAPLVQGQIPIVEVGLIYRKSLICLVHSWALIVKRRGAEIGHYNKGRVEWDYTEKHTVYLSQK